jgi:hypothetical protein
MGDERSGFLVLRVLRDMAGLIARLDRAFAEEACLANFRVADAEQPGFVESQSSQVDLGLHLAA